MYATEFSKASLRSLIRKKDVFTHKVLHEKHTKEQYLTNLEAQVSEDRFKFDRFRTLRIGAFSAYQPTRLGDTLILRKLDSVVRRLYSLRQSDRNSIVHQTQILLAENVPKFIYKLDIEKFFESIDRGILLEKLRNDCLLSPTSLRLISVFFDHAKQYLKYGVPRGLAISATLSELYLHAIDNAIPKIRGVYYYARYVDDILIFSCIPLPKIVETVNELLPGCMNLNAAKCHEFQIKCDCDPICGCKAPQCKCAKYCACLVGAPHEINYLGYKLITSRRLAKGGVVEISVEMADKKVNRLKSRIVKALLAHQQSNNPSLLFDRLRFLTENHRVSAAGSRGRLSSGIHFNYPLVTDSSSFTPLDRFLRAQVFAAANPYGAKTAASMSLAEKQKIAKLSFVSGFKSKRSRAVQPALLKQIRKCW